MWCFQHSCIVMSHPPPPPPNAWHRTKVLLELEVAGLEGGWTAISQLVSQLQSSQSEKRQGLDTLASKKKRVGLLANNAVSEWMERLNVMLFTQLYHLYLCVARRRIVCLF